jgi:hypothetical protein
MRGQQDISAKPGQQPAATVTADEPADVVTRHRGHERDHGHHRDVQPARARVDRSSDHHCLARDRHAEVLQEEQRTHRDVPVLVQVGRDGGEQAGQRRTRHPGALAPVRRALGEGMSLAGALPVRGFGMAQSLDRGSTFR